jgi:hypothetical protein
MGGDGLLSVTIVVTLKYSKSLKSLKNDMFWLQVSLFLSTAPLLWLLAASYIWTSMSIVGKPILGAVLIRNHSIDNRHILRDNR